MTKYYILRFFKFFYRFISLHTPYKPDFKILKIKMNTTKKFSNGFIPAMHKMKSRKTISPLIVKEIFLVMVVVSMFGTLFFYESNSKHATMKK